MRHWWRVIGAMAVVLLVGLGVPAPAWAAVFPIDEPFGGAATNNPDWVFTDRAHLTNEGDGWLRLTGAGTFEAGTAVLDDAFPTDLGVTIDFEYATWGGTDLGGHRGDGFSFFLIDGAFPPSIGQSGGGLGYTGMQGGYVGVGFDEFGNFSGGLGGPGQAPDTIAIRGSYAATPNWAWLTNAPGPGGTVETGDRAGFRKVRITVTPNAPHETMLSVLSNRGGDTPLEPVITDFDVAAAPGQPVLPPTFKLGFSGSTGGATNNHEIRNLTVTVPTDLAITKAGPATADPRQPVTYTLTATNKYPNPVSGARVTDTLPAGITDVRWTCAAGAGAACLQASGTGTVDVPVSMEQNTSVVVTVTGTVPDAAAETTIHDTAEIVVPADRTDLDPGNNTASWDTLVHPFMDLVTTKELTSSTPLVFGKQAAYTVKVVNKGPAVARGVVVTDDLPAAFATASADGCALSGRTLTCPVGDLAVAETRTFTVVAAVTGDADACRAGVTQTATATGTNTDRTPDDATASVTSPCTVPISTVPGGAALAIPVTGSPLLPLVYTGLALMALGILLLYALRRS